MAVRARTVSGRVLVVFLVLAMVAAACSSGSDPDEASPTEDDMESEGTSEDDDGVQLGAGDPTRSEEDDAPTVVEGEPLDADAVGAVFARLSDWEVPDDDVEDFNRPAETLPPPRTGDTVDAPFPPEGEAEPPEPPSGPLEVLRFQPEGEVEVAPSLSITFNQPMVELSTLEQLDTVDVPVTMTPEMEGRWEWIGTRTLRFEHESELIDRLPMATTYTVEVPAGTTSATGGELADTASWEFTTPPATVLSFGPDTDALPLEPIFVALFDQRVDPAAVLEVTKITADDEERPLRLATEAEVQQDDFASRVVEAALDGRWVAFRPTDPLTPDRAVKVRVGPDIPSAEGPSLNPDDATLAARTYAALQIVEHECGDPCEPGHPLFVRFNNPLDLDTFDPDAIEVTPELPGVNAVAQGDTIVVRGATAGRTTYEVTVPAELGDTFGQTLGDSATVSFDVGPARPSLQQFDQQVVTVDPLADTPALSVFSTNHDAFKVRMFPVEPSEWGAYLISQQRGDELQPPGTWTELPSRTVETGAEPDALTETSIDLTPALDDDGVGHVVVIVEPTGDLADLPERDPDYWANRPVAIWAQATRIGVDAFSDQRRLLAWTTDLATGEPLPDVAVALSGTEIRGTTDADGLATMELPAEDQWASSVVASSGADTALLPGYGNWAARSETDDNAVWYVFDDRGVYRPGETVRVKGWVRRLTLSDARLAPLGEDAEVAYRVLDPQGNELVTDRVALTSQGGFDLEIELPEGANLGDATIEFSPREVAGVASWHSHSFRIDEFRRPDFEVATEVDDPGPYLADTSVTATVEATYFSGGPLPAAPVEWVVTTNEATYTPPNQPAFHFGKWQPWWYEGVGFGGRALGDVFYDDIGYGPEPQPLSMEEFTGTTDADGRHALEVAFGDVGEGFPTTVSAEATVFDVNRQAWSSATDLLVHPGELYVGLRSDRTFVGQGDPLVVEAIVTDIDGEVVAERDLTIEASRLEWQLVDGEWTEVPADTETCEIASAAEPAECRFETAVGGSYEIVAKVADDDGRENHTEVNRWVSGGGGRPERNVQQETLTLIPDAEEYAPGDEVELLVASPFGEAHGLLTITRNGIVETESFTIGEEGSAVLTVPVTDDHVPNMGVQVDLVGATERTGDDGSPLPDAPPRPAFATGRLEVPVSAEGRALAVTATPADDVVDPGGETTLDVEVTDAVGAPVAGAEMAVVVVDEAVLAVTGYELTDPNDVFYAPVPADLASQYLRNTIRLLDPEQLALTGDLTTQAGGEETAEFGSADASLAPVDAARNRAVTYAEGVGGVDEPIQVRTDFDALAVYEPEVVTDASGMATIEVPLPDSLTRYRVMVVAVDGDESFGSAEANITAGLRLMVRPSPPRFLNFGDAFELPVVVQNRTDESMDVDVAVEVANLELTDGAGRRVSVPANDRIEVRFPAAAAEVGTARFRVAGVGGSRADAATGELPVYTPATSEAFATYGVVDEGATVQPLVAPEGVFPQFGGLEVDTSSTALQALTDAVLYLSEYRYESSDAYASRILAISALRDVLEAFSAAGLPAPEQLEATVARDLAALVALQNGDGGFPGWSRGRPLDPVPLDPGHPRAGPGEGTGLRRARSTAGGRAVVPGRHREPLPVRVLAGHARHAQRLRPPRAESGGRPRHRQGHRSLRPGGRQPAAGRGRVALARRRRQPRRGDPPPLHQPGHRDGGGGDLRHRLRRGRLPGAPLQPAHRRHRARRADRRSPRQRPDPQGGRRFAGQPDPRSLEQRAGEQLHPARAAPVLRDLRGPNARLRGSRLAGRPLRRRARVPGSLDRPGSDAGVDGRAPGAGRRRPDRRQGRARTALLPAGPAVRAGRSGAGPAGPRLRRRAHLRGGRRSRRRDSSGRRHLADPGRRPRAHAADHGGRQPPHPRGPGRSVARRARADESRAGHRRWHPRRAARRGDVRRWWDRVGDHAQRVSQLVVAAVVRAPEPARRPGRGLHVAALGRDLRLHLPRASHDAGHLRGPAHQGGGDLRPRDLRPLGQ